MYIRLTPEEIINGLEDVLELLRDPPDNPDQDWRRDRVRELVYLAKEIEPYTVIAVRFEEGEHAELCAGCGECLHCHCKCVVGGMVLGLRRAAHETAGRVLPDQPEQISN